MKKKPFINLESVDLIHSVLILPLCSEIYFSTFLILSVIKTARMDKIIMRAQITEKNNIKSASYCPSYKISISYPKFTVISSPVSPIT